MKIPFRSDGPVAGVQAEVNALETKLRELDQRSATLTSSLQEQEARLAEAIEAGKSCDSISHTCAKMQAELAAVTRIRANRESELNAAKDRLRLAPAIEKRQQATALRAELEVLQRKTAPLLEKLSSLEGVQFHHCILQGQRNPDGGWQFLADHTLDPAMFSPDEVWASAGQYKLTNSRRLYDQARRLEMEAAVLEGTGISSATGFRNEV